MSCPMAPLTQNFLKLVQCPFLSFGIGWPTCLLPGSRTTVVFNPLPLAQSYCLTPEGRGGGEENEQGIGWRDLGAWADWTLPLSHSAVFFATYLTLACCSGPRYVMARGATCGSTNRVLKVQALVLPAPRVQCMSERALSSASVKPAPLSFTWGL